MTVHHEINLKIPALQLAIFISLETLNNADIHAIALFAKLVIDNILHNMSVFYLSEVKNCISDTGNNLYHPIAFGRDELI